MKDEHYCEECADFVEHELVRSNDWTSVWECSDCENTISTWG